MLNQKTWSVSFQLNGNATEVGDFMKLESSCIRRKSFTSPYLLSATLTQSPFFSAPLSPPLPPLQFYLASIMFTVFQYKIPNPIGDFKLDSVILN